jgi:hypothetical protein
MGLTHDRGIYPRENQRYNLRNSARNNHHLIYTRRLQVPTAVGTLSGLFR